MEGVVQNNARNGEERIYDKCDPIDLGGVSRKGCHENDGKEGENGEEQMDHAHCKIVGVMPMSLLVDVEGIAKEGVADGKQDREAAQNAEKLQGERRRATAFIKVFLQISYKADDGKLSRARGNRVGDNGQNR